MIGDRETPQATPVEQLPPTDAALLFNPPVRDGLPCPPAWVERRGRMVIIRHAWPEGDATFERSYATEAKAIIGFACRVSGLRGRGYTDAFPDW